MKSYSYLVNKHLKIHRKRSILTMIGIVSSIILFFIIGYITNYSKDVEQIDYINILGDYDVVVYDIEQEDAKKLNNNIKIDKCGFYNIISEVSIELSNIKKDITIYGLDNVAINDIFYEKLNIKEGRVPKLYKEIMLNYSLKDQLGIGINDKFEVENVSYTVVGFYEENEYSRSTIFNGFAYLDKENTGENVNVIFKVKNKHNKIRDIKSVLNDSGVYYGDIDDRSKIVLNIFTVNDTRIIDSNGNINFNEQKILLVCLNLLVLILAIVLTHGSINISLNERKKEFAALRCIGATPDKIKKLLIKESIIICLLSLIPGIIIAQIISWAIIYTFPSGPMYISYDELNGKIYLDIIVNTILFIGINIFIATIIPLRKVGKLSPIEAIKGNYTNNKISKRRNSKLIRKLFGYIGELAYKNIRFNNKSFVTTILTLTILLIATISFNGYKILTDKLYNDSISGLTDLSITFDLDSPSAEENMPIDKIIKESKKYIKDIENLNIDSEIYTNISISKSIVLEGTTVNQDIYEGIYIYSMNGIGKEEIHSPRTSILILDEEYMNEIIPYINADGKKVDKIRGNEFIVVNTPSANNLSFKRVSPLDAKSGDKINLYLQNAYNFENTEKISPIKMNYLGSVESSDLINANRFGYYNELTLIVSEDFYLENKNLIKESDSSSVNILLNLDKNQDEDTATRKINNYVQVNNGYLLKEKESEIEYKIKNKVFYNLIYTGLVLLILISTVNLINIRSMDVYLREKEFKILLAIGINKLKLKKIIFLEGIMAWFISSVIGVTISTIVLIFIKAMYMYQGYLQETPIPFYIVFIYTIMLFLITIIISIVPYRKLKNIELNNLIKDEE